MMMVKLSKEKQAAAREAEEHFQRFCDEKNYHSLYFDQQPDTQSSYNKNQHVKRPDFLVSIPSIGNIFFDVKARSFKGKIINGKRFEIFQIHVREIEEFQNLVKVTGLPLWFAFFRMDNKYEILEDKLFLIPLDRLTKFSCENNFIWIPEKCFNRSIDKFTFFDVCQDCSYQIC